MIELKNEGKLWATVEHSGDICKIVSYNNVGNTAWVIPRDQLSNLITALSGGVHESR